MNTSAFKFFSKLSVIILCILGLAELGLALWTVLDNQYKILAYNLADVGYIDLWILRYLSLCLFASSIITLFMCLILIWGLCSAHVFLFIASTMIFIILIGEFTISILTFTSKYETRLTLIEQLPKLVITYRQGTDERAKRALDILQLTFRCCGADGRLSFQNNVPLSCNMFYIGCLTRTIFFLDACMDALAFILLFFSLIKLFIIIFFYSFLCLYRRQRQKRLKKNRHFNDDSSMRHQSSTFDSSSPDNFPRKNLMSSTLINQDNNENEYVDKRRVLFDEYDSSLSPNKRLENTSIILPSNESTIYYEENPLRKLSSISEKTETDDSETDLSHVQYYKPKRKPIITPIHQKQYPPVLSRKLPIIKNRRKIIREDENDSGVERSSSEKSFDGHNIPKQYFDTTIKSKSPLSLSFSKIFVTSVSQIQPTDDEIKKPLTTYSSSISDNLLANYIKTPKPILKKFNQQSSSSNRILPNYHDQNKISSIYTKTSPLLNHVPKTIPRTNIKQSKQDESLV